MKKYSRQEALEILERSSGIIKGPISAVAYQRKIRKGWEKRLLRQWRIGVKLKNHAKK